MKDNIGYRKLPTMNSVDKQVYEELIGFSASELTARFICLNDVGPAGKAFLGPENSPTPYHPYHGKARA